jgi:hypothetical protein
MECEICKTTDNVSQFDWGHYFCVKCSVKYFSDEADKKDVEISPSNNFGQSLDNIILFPFRLVWNIIVTGLIITGFVLWLGFIFGSVIGVILILIFAPDLFLLPLVLVFMYTKLWPE